MIIIFVRLNNTNKTIGGVFCFQGCTSEIRDYYKDQVKQEVEDGTDLDVFSNGDWVSGRKYFAEELTDTVEVDIEESKAIEKIEEEVTESTIPFTEIFDGHWTKQVQKVEEYDDVKVVEQILEYAKNNDVSDGIIKRIKEHLETL